MLLFVLYFPDFVLLLSHHGCRFPCWRSVHVLAGSSLAMIEGMFVVVDTVLCRWVLVVGDVLMVVAWLLCWGIWGVGVGSYLWRRLFSCDGNCGVISSFGESMYGVVCFLVDGGIMLVNDGVAVWSWFWEGNRNIWFDMGNEGVVLCAFSAREGPMEFACFR